MIYWSLKIYFLTKSWILLNLIINVFWGFLFCFDKAEFRSIGCVTSKLRRVWRSQRDNQNPYIEEKRTTQWPKEKVQKDKQRSTKEEFEDTTGLIRIRTKEKNRQHNGQKKKSTKRQTAIYKRRVWRYQRVNQNPYKGEEQTTQWTKVKIWQRIPVCVL